VLPNSLGCHEFLESLLGHLWLDPCDQKTQAVCDLLKPLDPTLMRRYEVSSRVNLVKNDDAACTEPVNGAEANPYASSLRPQSSCK
jgi:hypothetical protein